MLDMWMKDLVSSYQNMNDRERALVRSFLAFNLSRQRDIYLHDKMHKGMVEAPRAQMAIIASAAAKASNGESTPQQRQPSSMTASQSAEGGAVYRPSFVSSIPDRDVIKVVQRRSSLNALVTPEKVKRGDSKPQRRSTYSVKLASTGSISQAASRPGPIRQKIDLKHLDGTVYTDESSVDSRTNMAALISRGDASQQDSSEPHRNLDSNKRGSVVSAGSTERNNHRVSNLSNIPESGESQETPRNAPKHVTPSRPSRPPDDSRSENQRIQIEEEGCACLLI
jgi:hypothetical protein